MLINGKMNDWNYCCSRCGRGKSRSPKKALRHRVRQSEKREWKRAHNA